jgi:hypothetical protein
VWMGRWPLITSDVRLIVCRSEERNQQNQLVSDSQTQCAMVGMINFRCLHYFGFSPRKTFLNIRSSHSISTASILACDATNLTFQSMHPDQRFPSKFQFHFMTTIPV